MPCIHAAGFHGTWVTEQQLQSQCGGSLGARHAGPQGGALAWGV